MQIEKIKTYIGFAVRSNQIVFGLDNVKAALRAVKLIIYDSSVGKSTLREIDFLKQKADVVFLDEHFVKDFVFRQNCKIIGITNKELAKAIKQNVTTTEV